MRINIVSGDAMAQYGDELGFKNCIAFSESMINGKVENAVPFSQDFMHERAKTLSVGYDKYKKRFVQLLKMRAGDEVHVYFGEDLFCQLNLITLLAYLERIGIKSVTYHVVFEDQMKQTAEIADVSTQGFTEIYKSVLIEHKIVGTPVEIINKGLLLYSDYLDENGRLAAFIKENPDDTVLQLTVKIIRQLPEYGLGDKQCEEIIKKYRQ